MSKCEARRAEILARLNAGSISKDEAGVLLDWSRRQINRLVKEYAADGIAGVAHGNRHRIPSNKTDAATAATILSLARESGKYHGFNVSHIADLLAINENIMIGRSTLVGFAET